MSDDLRVTGIADVDRELRVELLREIDDLADLVRLTDEAGDSST
jgi:hypothetical protein